MAVKSLTRGYFPLLWITLLGFLIYGQTLTYDYTYLDDHQIILNQLDRINTLSYIPKAFTEDAFHTPAGKGFYYRPLLTVSFVVDAVIGGGKFAWFHLTNILLHILATWCLFLLLAEMGYERVKSFLFSLLFLVHPVLVHAVAWVPGRNDTLLAIFLFPSFMFFIKYLKTRHFAFCILHFAFYVLALFTKETAIILPLAGALYIIIIHRKYTLSLIAPVVAWLIITPVWMMVRYHVLGGTHGYPIADSIASMVRNLPAVIPFLGKAVVPAGLSVFPILKDMTLPMVIGIIVLIVFTVSLIRTKEKRWGYIIFGIAWFLLFLLPSFIKTKSQEPDFTEHRIYLSLAGLIIFLLETSPVKNVSLSGAKTRQHKVFIFFILFIFFVFSVLTVFHSRNYRDRIAFWTNAVKTSPSHAFNCNNLGAMHFLDQNYEEAEKYFRKAVEINPSEPLANGNIGLICMNTGRPQEAEQYYLREIRVNPTYDNVYYNLGLLYYQNNLVGPAIDNWEKTLQVNPEYTSAYDALVNAYTMLGKQEDLDRIRKMAESNGIK
jgi:hypothetical protein